MNLINSKCKLFKKKANNKKIKSKKLIIRFKNKIKFSKNLNKKLWKNFKIKSIKHKKYKFIYKIENER